MQYEKPDIDIMLVQLFEKIRKHLKLNNYSADSMSYEFLQTWGSTALGFEGIGGAAMTTAVTTVIHDVENNFYGVFFSGKFAYLITNPNEAFLTDLQNEQIASVSEANQKYNGGVLF